jgi:membrane-bound lytic murein transglycosylase B
MITYPDVKAFAEEIIRRHNLDREMVISAFTRSYFDYRVTALMDRPAERQPWSWYFGRMVTRERVNNGKAYMRQHQEVLNAAYQAHGVPPHVITAIIGIESSYGQVTMRYDAVTALATLAFEYPRRATYFRGELEQLFIIANREGKDPTTFRSSFAGALGIPQFMPGSLARFGKSADGGNRVDIINSHPDAIMSVANYLRAHGWKRGDINIVDLVTLEKPLPASAFAPGPCSTARAQSVQALKKLGVTFTKEFDTNAKGILSRMDEGDDWVPVVFFPNACAINKYNRSLKYTSAVGMIARGILAE